MAATQSSAAASFLARTRSGRVPANTAKTLATHAAPTAGGSAVQSSTSNVALFLTNLRLLDLDLLPDWPGLNALTFTSRDAAQGQRKRIQCVEWALYRLFAIWDPEEARNKFDHFFPPADQVQSLNLRAGLLRGLEQLKKNGVLGRDAVVRKTMLDECKGERLEEALAVFSSAVLKKVVAERQVNDWAYPAISQTLALESRGYSDDRSELSALILAHRGSLTKVLQEKHAARSQFQDFSELLQLKRRTIARRREQAKAAGSGVDVEKTDISDAVKLETWHTVSHNWSGNERWMEALLYGDSNARKDGLLTAPFDRVWRRVRSGRLSELEDQSGGLFEQLDGRVRLHNERLEKWKAFRKNMFDESTNPSIQPPNLSTQGDGVDLGFDTHENLHLGRMSPRKLGTSRSVALGVEYITLIDGLRDELDGIRRGPAALSINDIKPCGTSRRAPTLDAPEEGLEGEPVSELSDLEDQLAQTLPWSHGNSAKNTIDQDIERPKSHETESSRPDPTQRTRGQLRASRQELSAIARSRSEAVENVVDIYAEGENFHDHPSSTMLPVRPAQPTTPSPVRSPMRSPDRKLPQTSPRQSVSPTQQMANQILASMDNTSPSPTKSTKPRHTLTLADRTQLSMVRVPQPTDLSDDEPDISTLSPRRSNTASAQPPDSSSQVEVGEEYEDLVSRTRRSMANFEAARQKAQLERRRSQRKSRQPSKRADSSHFPAVDEGDGDTTLVLTEELIGKEDEAAIFMSRPKIKTSPAGSPTRVWD